MGILETILISIGLAMDAFAVSICKGLSMKKMDWKKALTIGRIFWIFSNDDANFRICVRGWI